MSDHHSFLIEQDSTLPAVETKNRSIQPEPPPPPKKKTGIVIVLVSVLVVALIGGAVFLVVLRQSQNPGPSLGLTYTSNGDGTCIVTGLGTCTDRHMIIPAEYRGERVIGIGAGAFANCSTLVSVTIPDSVVSVGYNAFENCQEVITVRDGVHYVDKWVVNRESTVTDVVLRKDTVGIANDAFSYSDLTSIVIPERVRYIGKGAFYRCSSLKSIVIPEGITEIRDFTFYQCTWLYSVTLPQSVKRIGEGAFAECDRLPSIDIPDGVTDIGKEAFKGCSEITDIRIPGSVITVGESAFADSGLASATIEPGLQFIGDSMFYGCWNLTSVIIPASVTRIGNTAFQYCDQLTDIFYTGTKREWNAITFGSHWNLSYVIHYDYTPNE